MMDIEQLSHILDAILVTAEKPLTLEQLVKFFPASDQDSGAAVNKALIRQALEQLEQQNQTRGFELKEVSSGYRYQSRLEYQEWVGKHWEEKPPRYSRALLEILALIIYRQPITRAEIEAVRGVAVSSHIIKTLQEREWIRVVGHKEVPGRPAMFATTKQLLDYFNLKSLEDMPALAEITNLDAIQAELDSSEQGETESEQSRDESKSD